MKCVILAAGYATRMYPLTKSFPKPLLPIMNSTILDILIDDLETIDDLDKVIIVSNHKFYGVFAEWINKLVNGKGDDKRRLNIELIDDGSVDNDKRLGAVADLQLAINKIGIKDDILVLAGDNLLDFTLKGFVEFANEKGSSAIMYYHEDSIEKLRRTGVIEIGENSLVISMEEKPQKPKSHNAVPPFYVYAAKDLPMIHSAIEFGCKVDAPGDLLMYMCKRCKIYAYEMPGKRIDVGCLEDYEKVKKGYFT